jgi:methyl-accepting chemotaxis protein
LDPAQLAQVKDFIRRVKDAGGLYWSFSDPEQFSQLVRLHLSRVVQEWAQERAAATLRPRDSGNIPSTDHAVDEADEEPGILDLMEEVLRAVSDATRTQDQLQLALQALNSDLELSNAELSRASKLAMPDGLPQLKRASNRAAEDLERFVRMARPEVEQFATRYDEAITMTGKAASLAVDFGTGAEVAEALEFLAGSAEDNAVVFAEFAETARSVREVVAKLPRITTRFNRARRATADLLDTLHTVLQGAQKSASEAARMMREITRSLSPPDA